MSPTVFESSTSLICFANKGNIVTVIDSSGAEILGSKSCLKSIDDKQTDRKKVLVYPNPATENSIIRLPYKMAESGLIVTNAYGQTVLNKQFENSEELPLRDITVAGIYFYKIVDRQNNQVYTGRFIYL